MQPGPAHNRWSVRSAPLAAGALGVVFITACSAVAWRDDSTIVREPGRLVGANRWTWVFLGCLIAAYVAYVGGLAALRRNDVRLGPVALLAIAIQFAPVAAPLLLSADAWVYWDYGRVAAIHNGNPYVNPPAHYAADPAYRYVPEAWRHTTSAYGPAFTLASEPVALAAGGSAAAAAWVYKGLAALAVLAATALAALVARRRVFAVAFVGWNPLLAVHFGGGGHNDASVVALVAGAVALERARRPATAGAAWAGAVAVKWLPLVLLPVHYAGGRRGRRRAFTAGLLGVSAAFALAASLFYGPHWLDAFGPIVRDATAGSKYALAQRLEQIGVPHTAALALVAVAFAIGYGWLLREARRERRRLGLTALLMLAASPWLVPWYAVWAVVLAAAEDDLAAQLLALVLCAYLLPQRVLI
jgi:glycosyl transferase family 87